MRASSPVVATYKAPLKGMDAREVKPEDAPNLLFNIDLSNRGYWRARPGLKKFGAADTGRKEIMGLHTTRVDGQFYLICVSAHLTGGVKHMAVTMFDGIGNFQYLVDITNPTSSTIESGSEPYTDKHKYSFVNAGRFVYFCNGYGVYWEMEIVSQPLSVKLRAIPLETGLLPLLYSYALGNLSPSSFTYFFDQIIISGFKLRKEVNLSIPATEGEKKNQPPRELLNQARDIMSVDSGAILAAEPALWRSFPVEDPSGFYWMSNESVVSTAASNFDLLVFGSKNLYKIVGHGGGPGSTPRRIKIGANPSMSPRGHCYFRNFVFFVSFDGCYVTDGTSVNKVSYEMDPLWFGREEPQTTRYVEQQVQKSAYPFHVNRLALANACCINDLTRQQVMVCLPANDSETNNMVWVYNYADMTEGIGPGKWSIWGDAEEPTFSGVSLDGNPFTENSAGAVTRNTKLTGTPSVSQSNTTYNLFHWNAIADDIHNGQQRIFTGNDLGDIYEFGVSDRDITVPSAYNRSGSRGTLETVVQFPIVISLGRIGRVDSDGRVICTDIAVRRKQLTKNIEDDSDATKLIAVVRSEGEGLKYFDVSEEDVEFQDNILNSQQGVSENTKSTLNTMVLGASPTGSNAPLMNSEYFEAYARVNVPDEEGRAAYVDLYSLPTVGPHRLQISEVRVYANVKGGSQREQS